MNTTIPQTALQLRSLITSAGQLELSLIDQAVPTPGPDEVLIRVEAAPINPADLGLLLGPADLSTLKVTGTAARPVVTATVPAAAMRAVSARFDRSLSVGIEGAGLVVAAGSSVAAQALLHRRVAAMGESMYGQYRCVPVQQCMALPDDVTSVDGASAFVNPITALGMVETMRSEGHSALIHTAAASNLGQMLNRVCQVDGVKLVNVVRKPEQVKLLRELGATYVCDSSTESFMADLTDAVASAGATIAFDATGGGTLGGKLLGSMEAALRRSASEYSRYGTMTHKQLYIYGFLDFSPTQFSNNWGMAWSMGGWLLLPFMQKAGSAAVQRLKDRVARELKTTFASKYSAHLSLAEVLQPDAIAQYARRATGEKALIVPNRD